ncbi:MAG: HAD-IA family hydrolase [Treponema sp.]|nr:HAD-IA family hydrolase [Treponema sp.]
MNLRALLFDCDGVLAETERDGHRVAYNRAMKSLGIDAQWQADEYGELVLISGGKERLKYYFEKDRAKFPDDKFGTELIQKIYVEKTAIFKEMVNRGDMPPRPGIARIVEEAHGAGILLFVCSTSHRESVEALLKKNYGEQVFSWFTELFCGDVVAKKKPAPDIYLLAKNKYGLDPACCCVIEDSRNGLLAAKAAGMRCLITKSYYTRHEDFSEADGVASSLGDPGGEEALICGGRLRKDLTYISLEDIRGF